MENGYGPIDHAALGGCNGRGWDQVKTFFMAEARRLGEEWFG